jgi:hypothetical protein
MHVEYKVCNGEVKVIEGACRIGGDMISELAELRYGVGLEECLVLLRCKLKVERAFGRYSPNGDGYYYGIKYLFSENLASSTPAGIEVLRQVKNVVADHRPGGGCGVEKRLGHGLVRSRSLSSLKTYLGELCDGHGAGVQDGLLASTIDRCIDSRKLRRLILYGA